MLRSGEFRHVINIQQMVDGKDDYGAPLTTWENVFTHSVRAAAYPLTNREFEQYKQINTEVSIKFVVRYLSGITSAMRVSFKGSYYEIIEPPTDKEMLGQELVLMCAEKSYDC